MAQNIVKPVADPLDDIDRVTPVDHLMARQDRADLPGNRSDEPGNGGAPQPLTAQDEALADPDDLPQADDDTVSLDDPDVALTIENTIGERPGAGPDDDDPIEETERLGDDARTA